MPAPTTNSPPVSPPAPTTAPAPSAFPSLSPASPQQDRGPVGPDEDGAYIDLVHGEAFATDWALPEDATDRAG